MGPAIFQGERAWKVGFTWAHFSARYGWCSVTKRIVYRVIAGVCIALVMTGFRWALHHA